MWHTLNSGSLSRYAKRILDVIASFLALVLLAPVLAAMALWVNGRLGAPVLFRQPRPGLHGKLFMLLKFRTMTEARDASGQLLPDARRMTPLGRLLRSTSLDELPELVNVLRGEMSLVGPRPLLPQYLERYTPEQARRHDVQPGITGLAQISGRNALTWEDRFVLDVYYIDHWSLWFDLCILARTIWTILKREGVSEPGQATASEFMGRRKS